MYQTFETTTVLAAIFLWIIFNFLGQMLNCDLQRVIQNNPYARNMLALLAFFFLFTVIDPNNNDHVAIVFGKTIVVFLLFILATKSRIVFVSIALMLLFTDQVIKNHVAYLERNMRDAKTIQTYNKIRRGLLYAIVIIILVGALDYLVKKKREHSYNFRWSTFFLGTHKCKE